MLLERRALYNSMRIHWLNNPSLPVEDWQVEDYRQLSLEDLFQRLSIHGIRLDRNSFISYAQNDETPEELTSNLIGDLPLNSVDQDRIYLLIFELWRRLLPEKRSLSIFCDELDYQIHLYDTKNSSLEALQDTLAYLQQLLEENIDQGSKPQEVFLSICSLCANDIESFIYNFITDQIDAENFSYASELLENFFPYVQENIWFEFNQARLLMRRDPEEANDRLRKIIRKASNIAHIDFNLEVLEYLVQDGEKDLFITLAKQTLPLLKSEEDLVDLLQLLSDYFHCLDDEAKEKEISEILETRPQENGSLSSDDPVLKTLKSLLRNSSK